MLIQESDEDLRNIPWAAVFHTLAHKLYCAYTVDKAVVRFERNEPHADLQELRRIGKLPPHEFRPGTYQIGNLVQCIISQSDGEAPPHWELVIEHRELTSGRPLTKEEHAGLLLALMSHFSRLEIRRFYQGLGLIR